jgi:hypothetical protein
MSERNPDEVLGGIIYTNIPPAEILIDEQQVYETNSLFQLVDKTHILLNVA